MNAAPADVLAQTGWARSVGGSNPYVTLFARAGTSREAADAAAADLAIHELPSARGCTYVVPARDFALALKVGQGFSDESTMKAARRIGVTDAEIERLSEAIVKALGQGPLDPDAIRESTGSAVRHLGAEGVKKGMATTLPVALGKLQATGDIRRVAINGRLDQQRYRYALWRPNPLAKYKPAAEEAYTELARRFFTWAAPATLDEFRWFSALGVKVAKAAVEPLGLVPMDDAEADGRLILPADRDAFAAFEVPREPQFVLVSGLDGITLLRRDVKGLLAPEDLKRKVLAEDGPRAAGDLSDLPNHGIFDRGRLVGLWEYDPESSSIAWTSFVPKSKALTAAVARTEEYIRSQLSDARSFSLDSPKSRAPRIAALRKAG